MVSILMCTYNRERFLGRAIQSVLRQTYTEWELIIVDDGSTDASRELVLSYEDSRITYIPMKKNRFYCYAANYGMSFCRGEYVAFLNSDDEWLPDKLEKQDAFMKKNREYGACFTEATLTNNAGEDISEQCADMKKLFATHYDTQEEWLQFFLFHSNSLCHPSAMVRKEILRKTGGFNLMYCQLADFDLWIRIVSLAPIYVIPECLVRFRWDVEKKKDQVSIPTTRHVTRSFNEQTLIREQMIERLNDEQFVRFFHNEFQNPDSASHLELEFEKAFLLMHCMKEVPDLMVLGIRKAEKVLKEEGAVEVLENHFMLCLQDIYGWNQEHWYTDPVISGERNCYKQQKKELMHCREEITRQQEEIDNLKHLLSNYRDSTSWKCTAPFRKLCAMVRNK